MSKITFTLGTAGDTVDRDGWLIIGYSAAAGGRTDIGVMVTKGMAWEAAAAGLHNNLNRNEWPQFIKGKVSGNVLRLSCPDELNDTAFSANFNPSLDQTGVLELNTDLVVIEDETF